MKKGNSMILKILVKFLEYENKAYCLPENLVALVWIQYSLLNLSYIYQYNRKSWVYILVLFARPQIIISIEYLDYAILAYLILWIGFFFLQNNVIASLISFINALFKVSLLNFIIELMISDMGFVLGIIVCLWQFLDLLFIQGTLSIITKNFQVPFINTFCYIRFIFNVLLIYLNQFEFSSFGIQFLAILSTIVSFSEIILYNKFRNENLRKNLGFIYLTTIILGILELIQQNNTYSIIFTPLIYRMFANISFPNFQETDTLIQASIQLQNNDIFKCFLLINEIKNDNIIRQAKGQILQKLYIDKINIKIQSSQSNIFSLDGVCKQLIENDQRNQIISENLNKLIEMKLNLFRNFKSLSFNQQFQYVQKASQVQKQIEQYYMLNKSSSMIQSLCVFFYAEIMNNYLKAQETQSSLTTTVETQIKLNDAIISKLIYIIYNYSNNKLIMKQVSSNAPKTFQSKQIDDLVPDGIREWHSVLVNEFIINGRSKFIRNFSQNYIVNGLYLENIFFAIDILYNGELEFICLIQPTILQTKTVVVNKDYEITALSEELSEFKSLSKYFFKGAKINKFIPKITSISETCYVENMIVIHSDQIKSANNLLDSETEINYFCDVKVEVKTHQDNVIFMIIQFDNFKRLLTKKNDEIVYEETIFDELAKSIPYETEQSGITEPYQFSDQKQIKNQNHQFEFIQENNIQHREQIFTPRDEEVSLVQQERRLKRYKSQFNKSQFQEEQVAQFNENQSQVSSLKMFRNSKFYRKYDLYDKYYHHLPYTRIHKLIIALIVLIFTSQLILIAIQLSDVSLIQLANDIELLKIKNLLFQPLEVFLVTRWTLFNYKNQLTDKQITQEDYNVKQVFARSNLDLGYDQLNINLESVLFKAQLQPELQSKYLNAYQYLDTYKNEQYNITLRGAISILLNFQYTLKMNYVIERTVGIDTPQVFYSYKNYKLLNDITTELNKDVEMSTLSRGDMIVEKVWTIFLLQQLNLVFLLLIIIILHLIINKRLNLCVNFKQFVSEKEIDLEIKRLKELLEQINADQSIKFSYQIALDVKELQFQALDSSQTSGKLLFQKNRGITSLFFFIYLLICYLFFTSNSITIFFLEHNYLQKYSQTTTYVTGFANLGIDVPCMFAQREILYGRSRLMYLTQTDFDYILSRIQIALTDTITFSEMSFDFSKILVTENFSNYFEDIQYNDLCNHIPESIQNKSLPLCSYIFNSNMNLGLKAILIQIQNQISTEMEINKFLSRNSTTPNELEGVFILSQIIKQMNELFFADLKNLTSDLVQIVYIINVAYMITLILLGIFWIQDFAKTFISHSKQIIQIIQIIPSYSIFSNDTFERALRSQINKN